MRAVDCLKVLLSPYLPFSSQRLHRFLGYETSLFGEQKIASYKETDRTHEVLIYDASAARGAWEPSALKPGQRLQQPKALFEKLDDAIAEEECKRLG